MIETHRAAASDSVCHGERAKISRLNGQAGRIQRCFYYFNILLDIFPEISESLNQSEV
jgi:hypothetical protein